MNFNHIKVNELYLDSFLEIDSNKPLEAGVMRNRVA